MKIRPRAPRPPLSCALILGLLPLLLTPASAASFDVTRQIPSWEGRIVYPPQAPAPASTPAQASAPASVAPKPKAANANSASVCRGTVVAERSVAVPLGKSTLLELSAPMKTRTLGNPAVVRVTHLSPKALYLQGTAIGSTNMIVQSTQGECGVFDIVVSADTAGLLEALKTLMPEETNIHVKSVADTLVLSGSVADAVKAQRVVELALRFVSNNDNRAAASPGEVDKGAKGGGDAAKAATRIINMLSVAAPQQVLLEVKVAEVSKTVLEQFGVNFSTGSASAGGTNIQLLTKFISANGSLRVGNGSVDAQKNDGLVRLLAEPNLMAVSGQKASFLAGGRVYIPVVQGLGNMASVTMEKEEYGVKLNFTPTVLENGRINLEVAPEVSELSQDGVSMVSGQTDSVTVMPLITTRSASTTIQIYDGQSYAISGLIKEKDKGDLKAIPGLSNIPILGALFRSTQYQQDRSELVFIVTPHLVKALAPNPPLPTDTIGHATFGERLLDGNLEGKAPNRASPASTSVPASAPMTKGAVVSAPASKGTALSAPATNAVVVSTPASKGTALSAPVTNAVVVSAPASKGTALNAPVTNTVVISAPASKGTALSAPATNGTVVSAPTSNGAALSAPPPTANAPYRPLPRNPD